MIRTISCDGDDCDVTEGGAVVHISPCIALDIPNEDEAIRIQVYLEDFGTMPPR